MWQLAMIDCLLLSFHLQKYSPLGGSYIYKKKNINQYLLKIQISPKSLAGADVVNYVESINDKQQDVKNVGRVQITFFNLKKITHFKAIINLFRLRQRSWVSILR